MNLLSRVTALFALLFSAQTVSFAASPPVELTWTELTPLIQHRHVQLTLDNGKKVKGEVIVVREDAIVLGKATIPRASVSLIKTEQKRGHWGRNLGLTVGILGGLLAGAYATEAIESAIVGAPLFVGVTSGVILGAHYLGSELDRRTILIKVIQ